MKPYINKFMQRDAPHPGGRKTPKRARPRSVKKAVRQLSKKLCLDGKG